MSDPESSTPEVLERLPPDALPAAELSSRAHSLVAVLDRIVRPQLLCARLADLPLLALGPTRGQRELLLEFFGEVRPIPLGETAEQPEATLSRLSEHRANSCSGAFGGALFLCPSGHEPILAELCRVVAPGGMFFAPVPNACVLHDRSPPTAGSRQKITAGARPNGRNASIVTVGEDWLLTMLNGAGFHALQVRIRDNAGDKTAVVFIGTKPQADAPSGSAKTGKRVARPVSADLADRPDDAASDSPSGEGAMPQPEPRARGTRHLQLLRAPSFPSRFQRALSQLRNFRRGLAPIWQPRAPALARLTRQSDEFSREFVTPLDGFGDLRKIALRLTVPSVPVAGRATDFAEHQWIEREQRSGDSIVCVGMGQMMISEDRGHSWDVRKLPELAEKRIFGCFTTSAGERLVQLPGWAGPGRDMREPSDWAAIYLLDRNLQILGRVQNGDASWHGPRAIGEANGSIIYAEYPRNEIVYTGKFDSAKWKEQARTSQVLRSNDGGRTWSTIFEKPPTEIRHFHLVVHDPFCLGSWWLTSGDVGQECRVWHSRDNGTSWLDVTNPRPAVELHRNTRSRSQAVFRTTDLVVLPDRLMWGSDDFLGNPTLWQECREDKPPMGARMFMARKSDRLEPVELAVGDLPFRNLIDVGRGYVALTEAKYPELGFEPRAYFIDKTPPHRMQHLFNIPNVRNVRTGFTYSRASRAAVDGDFFTFRSQGDLTDQGPRLLRWTVSFE